ncbi:MAG: hypothetical protein P4M14_12545, partial [Gammaproteobacteria bacterium]|nr:hypothetical protein [Gammaproteobacteria bacterium]
SKLNLVSNPDLVFDTDNGVDRRGLMQRLTNRFVDQVDYDKAQKANKKGVYLGNKDLVNSFNSDLFKLSMFQILLPYAQLYYKEGLKLSNHLRESFQELCKDNDKMQEFIEGNYETTENPKDKVHKDDFLELYRLKTNLKLTSWKIILNEIKRLGITYVKNCSYQNKQGCIIGLKLKEEVDDDSEKSDTMDEDIDNPRER